MRITYLVRPEYTPFNIKHYKCYHIAVVPDIDQFAPRTLVFHQLTEYWGERLFSREATTAELEMLEMMPMQRTRCHWYKYYSLNGLIEDEERVGVSPDIIEELKRIITEEHSYIPIIQPLLVYQEEFQQKEEKMPAHIKRLFNQQLSAEQRDKAFEIAEKKARQLEMF